MAMPEGYRDSKLLSAARNPILTPSMSEPRELELHAQRLQSLGELARAIAHDFNNALTGVRGYLQLMATRHAEDVTLQQHAERATQVLEQAAELSRKIVSFSRDEPQRTELVDLDAVVDDLRPLLHILAGQKHKLRISRSTAPIRLRADPTEIAQVVLNLALNARDAAARQIHIETATADSAAVLRVSDDGAGIEPGLQTQIFETQFTTKAHGSGLGLAIVRRVVDRARGSIGVDSTPGRGTTVELRFPRASSPRPETSSEPGGAAAE